MSNTSWEDGQQEYLESAQTLGARVCVALGWRAAIQFVDECAGNKKPLTRGALFITQMQSIWPLFCRIDGVDMPPLRINTGQDVFPIAAQLQRKVI